MKLKKVVLWLFLLSVPFSFPLALHATGCVSLQGDAFSGSPFVLTNLTGTTIRVAQSFPGAILQIYNSGTLTLATVYSDPSCTLPSNPSTVPSTGHWKVYAATGIYDARTSGTGVTPFTRTFRTDDLSVGTVSVSVGGTGANLSGGGGAHFVIMQPTLGGPFASHLLVASDIPALPASQITSGQLLLARGGTGADMSATGGAHYVVEQTSAGGVFTSAALTLSDLPSLAGYAQLAVANVFTGNPQTLQPGVPGFTLMRLVAGDTSGNDGLSRLRLDEMTGATSFRGWELASSNNQSVSPSNGIFELNAVNHPSLTTLHTPVLTIDPSSGANGYESHFPFDVIVGGRLLVNGDSSGTLVLTGNTANIGLAAQPSSSGYGALVVSGPVQLVGPGTTPTCNAANRGMFVYLAAGSGVKDTVEVCAKDSSDVYAYRSIY